MGGGAYLKRGRSLQILSLRRGASSKRDAYLKLGANSSIYGIFMTILPSIAFYKMAIFATFQNLFTFRLLGVLREIFLHNTILTWLQSRFRHMALSNY